MMFIMKIIGKYNLNSLMFKKIKIVICTKMNFGFFSRVQCLSNLAQLQQGGSVNSHVAQLTEVRSRKSNQSGSGLSKRDSLLVKQESTENLLKEKDDEIKRMQAMIAQMQTQLQSGATSLNSNDSTMV